MREATEDSRYRHNKDKRKFQMYQPSSFFGMLPEKKKVPACCKGRGEGDEDGPFLHNQVMLISNMKITKLEENKI